MPDIEQRLKALEKRARLDHERWQMLDQHMTALALIREAIIRPICAELVASERRNGVKPRVLQIIIANLKTFEKNARALNAHSKMIVELRTARKLFEAMANKGGTASPTANGGPRRKT